MDIIKQLEDWVAIGFAPQLVYDDNGHWALTFDGIQQVPLGDEAISLTMVHFVEKEWWTDSPEAAISNAMQRIEAEEIM